MTLIAVNYNKNRFWALSDSRASYKPQGESVKITDRFTKTYLVPYRFTSGNIDGSTYTTEFSGRVGFAFAGDIFAALAIQAMVSNILENMHDPEGISKPPTFDTIAQVFLRAAELFHEETIINPRVYEAFIFGFCPSTHEPRLSILTLKKENSIFKFSIQGLELSDGIVYSIGSGAEFFRVLTSRPENKSRFIEDIFREAVSENPDKGTGGAVQLMTMHPDRENYNGVLQADRTKDNVELFVSGVGSAELGSVDGYKLGRVAIGISAEEVFNRQELRRIGYDPDSPGVTQAIKNTAAFIAGLRSASNPQGNKLKIDDSYEVCAPSPVKGDFYFSSICKSCFLITPLLVDNTRGEKIGICYGSGKLHAKCIHCSSKVELLPFEMVGREWK